jgi:hypothetical protein
LDFSNFEPQRFEIFDCFFLMFKKLQSSAQVSSSPHGRPGKPAQRVLSRAELRHGGSRVPAVRLLSARKVQSAIPALT